MNRILITSLVLLISASLSVAQSTIPDRKLSLAFEATPLVAVLNMIAQQNGLNLVVAGDVDGEVTLRLDSVDVQTALDAVLTANGYSYFVRDDVIVVKPTEAASPGDLVSRSITLRYLDPVTAQKALFPRLSDRGQVVILDRQQEGSLRIDGYKANRISITEYPQYIDGHVEYIKSLDVLERTVLIEARIIETTVDNDRRLGFNWPSSIETKLSGADDGTGTANTNTTTTTSDRSAGAYDPNNGTWTWGKLSVSELRLVLDMLEQDGNSQLVSDPRITTTENHEAEFKFTTIIPIQTINRFTEGAATQDIVTFEDEEVGLELRVTPRINEDGRITLEVNPKVEDIIGFNGPPENQKPITSSRSISTRITVKDGETVALGGLLKEDEIETVKRVPLLGSIPLLGKLLFTNKSVEKNTTDLLILITPHILD